MKKILLIGICLLGFLVGWSQDFAMASLRKEEPWEPPRHKAVEKPHILRIEAGDKNLFRYGWKPNDALLQEMHLDDDTALYYRYNAIFVLNADIKTATAAYKRQDGGWYSIQNYNLPVFLRALEKEERAHKKIGYQYDLPDRLNPSDYPEGLLPTEDLTVLVFYMGKTSFLSWSGLSNEDSTDIFIRFAIVVPERVAREFMNAYDKGLFDRTKYYSVIQRALKKKYHR
jgi:hypothetical protein